MENKPMSAFEKMRLEEARQENLMGSMKFIFEELSPKNKFRLFTCH